MTNSTAKDYLGPPCKFTEAKERFSEPLTEAKAMVQREIRRRIGHSLLQLANRLDHANNASRALVDMADAIDDDGELHALMKMFSDHAGKTANEFWKFAGLILAALDTEPTNTQ